MSTYLMSTYNRQPVTFVRGAGARLWDDQDREYLDALSGIAVTGLGLNDRIQYNPRSLAKSPRPTRFRYPTPHRRDRRCTEP